ncbi:hypothetical protein A3H10_00485 [Candidatus Uhrbacteria bacterium RIFCSPLOWO2_12_FULL_46_10]|uniref:Rod shape-determining protein MreD n=1 Tax=Candidatus Uhrbacteria bacterium RIFCSPLOWO2_01_FULL_47_25 TaxID=1802402 RepID=A0A1F7US47_9BACT|nr:MAG: hypothetical protein UX68_C0010G0041 [Parcubacteria group bacterium GW2011_GWA2_46_9]OGL59289.1 MAG: hypothetical protein A2752_01305 [Candidatus Uhrbacteria bacterium RIFCSPHIGHO2_01_FULL_46_23]OGL68466.1 MAG: hypothetical protein A3D60_02510 [Candidatus Uhrbacteria bacterium RIFCSPHIGHO2_02_FULL_47_29]OGL75606.1 MAG: hypothetical protein A3E96_01025 [Candidatus Uhrbacteria bacterium RIFCSPHIGHO2_12_FULL_46_13]OGL81122.1 MAG: hypothetical protein A2936_00790 [Candidatus Uhrbacteria bac
MISGFSSAPIPPSGIVWGSAPKNFGRSAIANLCLWGASFFIIFGVAARLLYHAPNFVPIGALALWVGVYLPKRYGFFLPIAVMLISDFFIGFYDWRLMMVVYASFAIIAPIGWIIRKNKSASNILLASLSGSVIFFITTNFAVWYLSNWYAHTPSGLLLSYTMAIPFFRNSLLADLFYNASFFSVYELALAIRAKKFNGVFARLTS